jgi:5-methylcytosine-specific restriction enzyme A
MMRKSAIQDLEIQFHKDMLNIYENAKKIGYNASRFRQMVANQGGLTVAKKFIQSNTPSEGFISLWELGSLDLTVEALILKDEYISLFSLEERKIVADRLKEYGYELPLLQNPNDNEAINIWIFQGNPNVFDIDNYVQDNKFIWWSLRQEHFADEFNINDKVFLWKSDGGKKGTGGVVFVNINLSQSDHIKSEPLHSNLFPYLREVWEFGDSCPEGQESPNSSSCQTIGRSHPYFSYFV